MKLYINPLSFYVNVTDGSKIARRRRNHLYTPIRQLMNVNASQESVKNSNGGGFNNE